MTLLTVDDLLESQGIKPTAEYREQVKRAAELELARKSLLHFTKFTFPIYKADPFHIMVADVLTRVVRGELKKVMIFSPPQAGKSHLVSVHLPAFWFGNRPNDPVILCSYGASLAQSKSRSARALVESSEFQQLFPTVRTSAERRAVEQWEIAAPYRGGLVAAGVGSALTGHPALLAIIDDPVQNWATAQSKATRDSTWDWYKGTFRTRVWEDGAIVLIQTRWHNEDLAGMLLEQQSDEWEVLRFPALAETQRQRDLNNERIGLPAGLLDPLGRKPNESVCPSRFSVDAYRSIRSDVGSMVWSAEYQGSPTMPEGNTVKRHWFKFVDIAPARGLKIRYWDKAGTAGGGAYTAGVLILKTDENEFFVLDVERGQWSSGEREEIILNTAHMDGKDVHVHVEQEPGSGGKESADSTIRKLAGFSVYADRATGSKDVRLTPFAAQLEGGNVYLVRAAWNRDYIDELCAIPNSSIRDQADASAGAFNKLAEGTARLVVARMGLRRKWG